MRAFDNLAPGLYSKNTLLYGVEVKFYSSKVTVDEKFETKVRNFFAIGDGADALSQSHAGIRHGRRRRTGNRSQNLISPGQAASPPKGRGRFAFFRTIRRVFWDFCGFLRFF